LPQTGAPPVLLTSAFFAMLVGLFLMVTRRKAITQSLAYLVMENGVYGIGVSLSLDFPFLVELSILLDVFVGVFLMGNLLFHLDREFEHLDADRMTELTDLSEVARVADILPAPCVAGVPPACVEGVPPSNRGPEALATRGLHSAEKKA